MKTSSRSVAVAALLLVSSGVGPRAQVVAGRTLAHDGGAPLEAVEVSLRDSADIVVGRALSDVTGAFLLPVPRPGTYVLEAVRIGYATARGATFEVHPAEGVAVEIRLGVQAVALEPLVVTGRVSSLLQRDLNEYLGRAERDRTVDIGTIFTREDLSVRDTWTLGQFMERAAPRVGRTGCRPSVFVDGSEREMDALQSLSNIEGIEFYRGFGPPESRFTNMDGCGVVLVWSRPLATDPRAHAPSLGRLGVAAGLFALLTLLVTIR